MNKKYVKVALVAVVALVGGINVFNAQKSESMSDIALANVEALAETENSYTGLIYLKGEFGTGGCINCAEQFDSNCTCR